MNVLYRKLAKNYRSFIKELDDGEAVSRLTASGADREDIKLSALYEGQRLYCKVDAETYSKSG
jgi:hypothetical protein